MARRGLPDPRAPATTLAKVEGAVSRLLGVPETTTEALAARLARGEAPLLLDVRALPRRTRAAARD